MISVCNSCELLAGQLSEFIGVILKKPSLGQIYGDPDLRKLRLSLRVEHIPFYLHSSDKVCRDNLADFTTALNILISNHEMDTKVPYPLFVSKDRILEPALLMTQNQVTNELDERE